MHRIEYGMNTTVFTVIFHVLVSHLVEAEAQFNAKKRDD